MPSASSAGLSLEYLPVDGIHTIFSFLPLEEAVRGVRVCWYFQRSLWTSSPAARDEYKRPDKTEHGWWGAAGQESVCGSGSFATLKAVKDTNGRYVELQAETPPAVAASVGNTHHGPSFVWAGSSLTVSPAWAFCPLRRLTCLVSACPHLTSLTVSSGNCPLSLEKLSTLLFGLYTRLRWLTIETEAEQIALWERLTAPHLSDYFDQLSDYSSSSSESSSSEPRLGQFAKTRVGRSTKTKRGLESFEDDISSPTKQIIGPKRLYVWCNLQSLRLIGPAAVVNVRLFCRRMCYPDLRELEVHLNIKPPRESICRTSPPSVSCCLPSNSPSVSQSQVGSRSAEPLPPAHPFLRALSTNPTAQVLIGLPAGVPVPVAVEPLYDWTATLAGCKRCLDDAEDGGVMPQSRAEEIRQTKRRLLSCRRRPAETESLIDHSSPPIAALQSGESGESCCYREGAGFRLERVLFEIRGLTDDRIYQDFEGRPTALSNRYVANVVLRLMWDLLWKHQYRPLRLGIGLQDGGGSSHARQREAPARLPADAWLWLRGVNAQGGNEEDEPVGHQHEQGLAREGLPPLPDVAAWEDIIPEGLGLRGGYGNFHEPGDDAMPYFFRGPPAPSSITPPNVLVCKCVRDSLCGIPHWNLADAVDDWFFTHYSNLERIYDSRGEFDRFVDLTAPPYEMY